MISYIVCHAGMICASTVLSNTRKFAMMQQPYSDARLRLCWFLALFAVLVRESFQLSRTVGHSPYLPQAKSRTLCKHSSALYPHSRIRADALCILLRCLSRSIRTLAFGFAGCWLYLPCLSGKAFCFPGLSGIRPIFLKLKAELCASTVLLYSFVRHGSLLTHII